MRYTSISERLALATRAWASIDWKATDAIIEEMIRYQVCYCGMAVITKFQVGEDVAELEADADYHSLFGLSERNAFRDFSRCLQGNWTRRDLDYACIANDSCIEWLRRFRDMGGVLLAGTDMQFGGIMLHRELCNLEPVGMPPLEVITAATGGSAKALHVETEFGLLCYGLSADLVLLNRDPLQNLTA